MIEVDYKMGKTIFDKYFILLEVCDTTFFESNQWSVFQ